MSKPDLPAIRLALQAYRDAKGRGEWEGTLSLADEAEDLLDEVERLRAELDPAQRDGAISLASMLHMFSVTTEKGEPPMAHELRECAAAARLLQVRTERLTKERDEAKKALADACNELEQRHAEQRKLGCKGLICSDRTCQWCKS